MHMIVKAELVLDDGTTEESTLASFRRDTADLSVRSLGLTLDDGKHLVRQAQQRLTESQAACLDQAARAMLLRLVLSSQGHPHDKGSHGVRTRRVEQSPLVSLPGRVRPVRPSADVEPAGRSPAAAADAGTGIATSPKLPRTNPMRVPLSRCVRSCRWRTASPSAVQRTVFARSPPSLTTMPPRVS